MDASPISTLLELISSITWKLASKSTTKQRLVYWSGTNPRREIPCMNLNRLSFFKALSQQAHLSLVFSFVVFVGNAKSRNSFPSNSQPLARPLYIY